MQQCKIEPLGGGVEERKKKKTGRHFRCWIELDDQARGKFRNVKSLVGKSSRSQSLGWSQLSLRWSCLEPEPRWDTVRKICLKRSSGTVTASRVHSLTHGLTSVWRGAVVVATMAVLRKLLMWSGKVGPLLRLLDSVASRNDAEQTCRRIFNYR